MIAEGRRTTTNWGWAFVLWGIAFYVAIAWESWGHSAWTWPVTMTAAAIVCAILASLKAGHGVKTTLGRTMGSIWIALGISMFLLFLPLGMAGKLADPHLFFAIVSAMLGMANATSAMILRWKAQFGCAVVWWAASAAACFGTESQATAIFLVAILICQIAFGLYGTIRGGGAKSRRDVAHA